MRRILSTLFPVSVRQAAVRASLTFVQTVGGIVVASWVADPGFPNATALVDVAVAQADFAAGSGIFAMLGSLGLHSWLQRRRA